MTLGLLLIPLVLAWLAFVVALAIDATRRDRASARRAAVLRETVPILPWPDQAPRQAGGSPRPKPLAGQGRTAGRFLRNLALLVVVVFLAVTGGIHLFDQMAPEPRRPDGGPGQPKPQPAEVHTGGEACARGA